MLVEALLALMLFAVERLPNRLLDTVADGALEIVIPRRPTETDVLVPVVVIDPITLLLMVTVPVAEEKIGFTEAPVVLPVTSIEPVPVDAPITFPVTLPIRTLPRKAETPQKTPPNVDAKLEVDQSKFLMVLFCTLTVFELPPCKLKPVNVAATLLDVTVHAVPPALELLPPI